MSGEVENGREPSGMSSQTALSLATTQMASRRLLAWPVCHSRRQGCSSGSVGEGREGVGASKGWGARGERVRGRGWEGESVDEGSCGESTQRGSRKQVSRGQGFHPRQELKGSTFCLNYGYQTLSVYLTV